METISLREKIYYFHNPTDIARYIDNHNFEDVTEDISILLEFYTLKIWINNVDELFPRLKKELLKNISLSETLKKTIGQSLSKKEADNWMHEYLDKQKINQDSELKLLSSKYFQEMFNEYNFWTKLSKERFKDYIWSNFVDMKYVLSNKKIVKKFSDSIYDNLLNDKNHIFNNIEIIESLTNPQNKFTLPEKLKNNDSFDKMVNKLIDYLEEINFNDVTFVQPLLDFKLSEFPLTEKTRERVNKYVQIYWENFKSAIMRPQYSLKVSIIASQENELEEQLFQQGRHIKISKEWLDSIEKDKMLFNIIGNFVVDEYNRPISIAKPKISTGFVKMLIDNNYKGKRLYQDDYITMAADIELTAILYTINSYFDEKNLSFEILIAEYFNKYIESKYKFSGFSMEYIDKKLPYKTKIKLLAIEMESILKQFKLLVEYEEINLEGLSYMDVLDIDNLPSFISNRYIEINQEGIDINKKEEKMMLDYLLATHNYLSEYLMGDTLVNKINQAENIEHYSNLFSHSEAKFISYCLNNKEYDNALAIRNKYLHGSTIHFNEEQHKNNYIIIIKVFLIVIAKVEEELAWRVEYSDKKIQKG